ncbi:putative S-locus receptor-like protein kinase family protein [Panicum miliaceum]|uniref:S-locus receptor-like protein kinase family protein n=1 Tax=Panicum miliaceum TaxID=4540 RepID=A0A3L6TCR6_PANMI|nr:putative S-locus receptor-like protein kinase family protein [Panicum miliaceum]
MFNCTGDGFLPLRGVKLPDTTNATEDTTISVDQCRQRCLANCSCLAYSASSIKGGGSGCIIWSSLLIDIRHFAYGGEDLYIRLAAGEQASLLSQAWRLWREGSAVSLLDEAVAGAGAYRGSEVRRCVQVALLCVQERPDGRPHMAEVFLALGNPGAVLPQPRHPGFCSDRGSTSTDGEWSSTCTVNDVTVTIVEGR